MRKAWTDKFTRKPLCYTLDKHGRAMTQDLKVPVRASIIAFDGSDFAFCRHYSRYMSATGFLFGGACWR